MAFYCFINCNNATKQLVDIKSNAHITLKFDKMIDYTSLI